MNFYYDESYEERNTYHNFQRKCDDLYECREIVQDILKILYSTENLNVYDLEQNIGELCHVLKVKMPSTPLTLNRTQSPLPDYISEWVDRNNNYLKSLTI